MDMLSNILTAYDNATAADANEGTAWYADARAFAAGLAAGTLLTVEHAAGVIAALSPRVRWNTNKFAAATIVDAAQNGRSEPTVAGLTKNRAKAWVIALGRMPLDVLGGQKVRAFYANILGDEDAVTVDVWAARVALGPDATDRIPARQYVAIADAYRLAADMRGVSPMVMQATTWVYIRRIAGEK